MKFLQFLSLWIILLDLRLHLNYRMLGWVSVVNVMWWLSSGLVAVSGILQTLDDVLFDLRCGWSWNMMPIERAICSCWWAVSQVRRPFLALVVHHYLVVFHLHRVSSRIGSRVVLRVAENQIVDLSFNLVNSCSSFDLIQSSQSCQRVCICVCLAHDLWMVQCVVLICMRVGWGYKWRLAIVQSWCSCTCSSSNIWCLEKWPSFQISLYNH